MPVSFCTVAIVQAGPPSVIAELNMPMCSGSVLPADVVHAGMSTQESRGMLMPMARVRSGDRWISIVVSERSPSTSVPYFA